MTLLLSSFNSFSRRDRCNPEARILQELKHSNIVKFKGICNSPFALILEYVYFDFKPFGIESKVSSVAEFLGVFEGSNCNGFDSPQVISTICVDMAVGLQYLHDRDVPIDI